MGVPLKVAARQLQVSQRTLQRWATEPGFPIAQEGGPGRGKGARVNVDAIKQWRCSSSNIVHIEPAKDLRAITRLALAFHRQGQDPGHLGQRSVGISDSQAADYLTQFVVFVAMRLGGTEELRAGLRKAMRREAAAEQELGAIPEGRLLLALSDEHKYRQAVAQPWAGLIRRGEF
jgi:hypothetical protein